jgi:hypothetical protein
VQIPVEVDNQTRLTAASENASAQGWVRVRVRAEIGDDEDVGDVGDAEDAVNGRVVNGDVKVVEGAVNDANEGVDRTDDVHDIHPKMTRNL